MYLPAHRPYDLLVFGVLVLSLWATITNAVPLSVVFGVLAPTIAYALPRTGSIPRVTAAALLLYAYFAISTLLYAPTSFVDPAFYRRDGNFFLTFLPLLIGGVFTLRIDLDRVVSSFLKWVTALQSVLIALYLATGGTLIYHEPGVFHSLFEAHNAAGGFLSMVTALCLGFVLKQPRKLWPYVALLVNGIATYLTVSRGSMLGLVLAVLLIVVLRGRFLWTASIGMAIATLGLLAYVYPLWLDSGRPVSIMLEGQVGLGATELASADSNLADRLLFLWPRAFDLFLQSPWVGAGYGSYNDVPYILTGIPHVLMVNRPIELVFNSAHAHNSYLHVLAECGILGLALVVLLLRHIWAALKKFPAATGKGLSIALWVAIFSAATEHRMFTPAQMLPFTIILALGIANMRAEARARLGGQAS